MERFFAFAFMVTSVVASLAACQNLESLPQVEIQNVQVQQVNNRYQIVFELSGLATWEVEASDQTDDVAAFFTIAQSRGRHREEAKINTGPLELNMGEAYMIRILAYTSDDLRAGRAAMRYVPIDK